MKKITGGLYFLYDKGQLVYIGKSSNVFWRIGQHIHLGIKQFDEWEYQVIEDEQKRSELEGYLIDVFNPKYNEKKEPNIIFKKEKGKKYYDVNIAMETYDVLKNYNIIPIKVIDDIFGINDIWLKFWRNGYIPDEQIKKIKGYQNINFIDKEWLLNNIANLIKSEHTLFDIDKKGVYEII